MNVRPGVRVWLLATSYWPELSRCRSDFWPAASAQLRAQRSADGQLHIREQLRYLVPRFCLHGPIDEPAVQVRREELQELIHISPQQPAAVEADPGRVDREQVRPVDRRKIAILLGVDREIREDADT